MDIKKIELSDVEKIELSFENSEFTCIPIENVASLHISEMQKQITKHWYTNHVDEREYAETAYIFLNPAANIQYSPLNEENLFDRIVKYNDLVSIEFQGVVTKRTIYLEWDDEDAFENSYQTSLITKNEWPGCLLSKVPIPTLASSTLIFCLCWSGQAATRLPVSFVLF